MATLDGKSALITGAASGIGAAIARRLYADGAMVTIADIAEEAGQELAVELGGRARFQRLDVTSESEWATCVADTSTAQRGLHILVNNAGIVLLGDIFSTSLDQFEQVMRVNSTGCFLGCRTGLEAMRFGGGAIVNISSIAAMAGIALYPAYSASKGAVRSLTKSVAATCRDNQIPVRCNSVHPGAIDTPMTRNLREDGGDSVSDAIVPGMGQPEDVAAMVAFLVSEESQLINGAEMLVDGTLCMG